MYFPPFYEIITGIVLEGQVIPNLHYYTTEASMQGSYQGQ